MSNRKRVNVSLDPFTYHRLQELKEQYGFCNLCELMVALAHILLDRMQKDKVIDIPEDDGKYIDDMFKDLGNVIRQPNGEVPVRHNNKNI